MIKQSKLTVEQSMNDDDKFSLSIDFVDEIITMNDDEHVVLEFYFLRDHSTFEMHVVDIIHKQ